MHPGVTSQLRVERGRKQLSFCPAADRYDSTVGGAAVDLREHLDPLAGGLHPGGADEDRVHRPTVDPGEVDVGLERIDLASEGIAAYDDVEVLAEVDGHPVAVRQGNVLAVAFHPEIDGDTRLHEWLLERVQSNSERGPQ